MGLAASQARFLGITARKSNIEYEGQQVNQQRTALAEEVNALYNKLLAMKLPIAPDTTEFYQSNYAFEISDVQSGMDGKYLIQNYYENADGTYYVSAKRKYETDKAKQDNLATRWEVITETVDGKSIKKLRNKQDYGISYELSLITDSDRNSQIASLINADSGLTPVPANQKFYSYRDDEAVTHYIPMEQVTGYNEESLLIGYKKAHEQDSEAVSFDNVRLTFDENNRISSITLNDAYRGLEVNTERTYNTEGYDAALRDYTMSKDEYDKTVADLNAQTESLQQEDKVLELRLNQIDTEQNELQTELEAVKAILDKNIENTFNTFS